MVLCYVSQADKYRHEISIEEKHVSSSIIEAIIKGPLATNVKEPYFLGCGQLLLIIHIRICFLHKALITGDLSESES